MKKPKELNAIVYYSDEDKCCIAHSVECDQIGTGDNIKEAIKNLETALKAVYDLCVKDKTLAFYRDAPKDILKALETAKAYPILFAPVITEVPRYFKINNYDFSKTQKFYLIRKEMEQDKESRQEPE